MSASAGPIGRVVLRMLVDGRLPDALARYAHHRAMTDASWAQTYHELRVTERALERANGSSSGLSSSQHAFLRARVLAAAGAAAPKPVMAHATSGVPWLAGAAAAASLTFFVVAGRKGDDDGGFQPRSAHTSAHDGDGDGDGDRDGGIRVHCVNEDRTTVLGEEDLGSRNDLRCPAGGLLAFSATNRTDRDRWPAVLAKEGDVVAFTVPFDDEPSVVPRQTVALRLARGAPLEDAQDAQHAQPRERVLVLKGGLFDEPVPSTHVARALNDDDEAPSLRVVVVPK